VHFKTGAKQLRNGDEIASEWGFRSCLPAVEMVNQNVGVNHHPAPPPTPAGDAPGASRSRTRRHRTGCPAGHATCRPCAAGWNERGSPAFSLNPNPARLAAAQRAVGQFQHGGILNPYWEQADSQRKDRQDRDRKYVILPSNRAMDVKRIPHFPAILAGEGAFQDLFTDTDATPITLARR